MKNATLKLLLTRSEARALDWYRNRNMTDSERAASPARLAMYSRFLAIYEAMRATPGHWLDKNEIASMTGLSARHARRMILLFQALRHPRIEVEYSKPSPTAGPSRMRYRRGK